MRGEGWPWVGEIDETSVVPFELLITLFKADLAFCLWFCVGLIKICAPIKGPGGSSPETTTAPVKHGHPIFFPPGAKQVRNNESHESLGHLTQVFSKRNSKNVTHVEWRVNV